MTLRRQPADNWTTLGPVNRRKTLLHFVFKRAQIPCKLLSSLLLVCQVHKISSFGSVLHQPHPPTAEYFQRKAWYQNIGRLWYFFRPDGRQNFFLIAFWRYSLQLTVHWLALRR